MRRFTLTMIFSVLSVARVEAQPLQEFDVSAAFRGGGLLSGVILVNPETGNVAGGDVRLDGDALSGQNEVHFTHVISQQSLGYAYTVTMTASGADAPELIFGERDSPVSLKGYAGGLLGPRTAIMFGGGTIDNIIKGYLWPISSGRHQS